MAMRRQLPRQPAEWIASYRFENDYGSTSRPCRVLDISTAGAGLQLLGTSVDESLDRMIVVSVALRGETRSAIGHDDDEIRVGIEFPDLCGEAADYVKTLRGFGARTRW